MRQLIAEIAIALLVAFAVYIAWDKYNVRPVGSESVSATVAPAVKGAPRVPVTIKAPVQAIEGKAKANLKLPDAVQKDPDEQVIAASQVKGDLHPQTISTVVNAETGEVQTFTKIDPYPWFAIEPRGAVGIAYGYKFKAGMPVADRVTRLKLDYDVVRVKALTVGVTGTVDTDRDAFVGVGVTYRW